jgi:hypothetical protein
MEFWDFLKQGNRFLNLFFHWSWGLRGTFFRFLLYSLFFLHTRDNPLDDESEEALRNRLLKLQPNPNSAEERNTIVRLHL